jgi:VanZ family protein
MEILFCLPSYSLPDAGVFEIPYLDKLVHFALFGVFVFSWGYYLYCKKISTKRLKNLFFGAFLIAVFNGILIEYIQLYFIPGRSFDESDIIADLLGGAIGYGICNIKLLKINS